MGEPARPDRLTRDEADAALAQAIRDHAAAYDLADPDEMLNDYAVIANWQPVEDRGGSRYTSHYHRHSVPTHVAVGLFTLAAQLAAEDRE